jgi:hypothetical protein
MKYMFIIMYFKISLELETFDDYFRFFGLDRIALFEYLGYGQSGTLVESLHFVDVDWGHFLACMIDFVAIRDEHGLFAYDCRLSFALHGVRVVVYDAVVVVGRV